jgi:hypothetical protein
LANAVRGETLESRLSIRRQAAKARHWTVSSNIAQGRLIAPRRSQATVGQRALSWPSKKACEDRCRQTAGEHVRSIADELLVQKRREGRAPSTMAKLEGLLGLARTAMGDAHERDCGARGPASPSRRGGSRKARNRPPPPRLNRLNISFRSSDAPGLDSQFPGAHHLRWPAAMGVNSTVRTLPANDRHLRTPDGSNRSVAGHSRS